MTSEQDQTQKARATIDQFIQHVRADSTFAKEYKEDPVGVLLKEGLPAEGIVEVLHEDGYGDQDVVGFATNYPTFRVSLTPRSTASSVQFGASELGFAAGCITTQCCCTSCCVTL